MRCRVALLLVALSFASGVAWAQGAPLRLKGHCVLGPDAAPAIMAALGYGQDWRAQSGVRVTGIEVSAERVGFLAEGRAGPVLVLTHGDNAPEELTEGWISRARGDAVVWAPASAPAAWIGAADEVATRLQSLPWRCRAPERPSLPAWAPWLAWLLLAAGASGLGRGLRRAWPSLRLGGAGPPMVALALISLVPRLMRWSAGPLHFVEIERVPPAPEIGYEVLASLAAPLLAVFSEGVQAQAALTLALGALAPLLLVPLGAAWAGPGAGWLAGLLLAMAPLQLRFAASSNASVALTTLLLAAVLATEVAAVRGKARNALSAAILWGLACTLRPEALVLLVALAGWIVWEERLRVGLRRPMVVLAWLVPLALGAAWALRGLLLRPEGVALWAAEGVSLRAYAGNAWASSVALVLDPSWHPWPLGIAAALGCAFVLRGPARVFALGVGLVLPGLVFALQGHAPATDLAIWPDDLRTGLYTQPFWLLAAAAALAWSWAGGSSGRALATGWGLTLGRALAGLAVAFALLAPGAWWARVDLLSPLEAEHAFMAAHGDAIPARALVLVDAPPDARLNPLAHVEADLRAAGRSVVSGDLSALEGGEVVVVASRASDWRALPAGVPVYGLEGWYAYVTRAPPWPSAETARIIASQRVRTSPRPGEVADLIRLRLLRLR